MIDVDVPLIGLPERALRRLRALNPIIDAGKAGYEVGKWGAEQGGYISGATSLDLFTPGIRVYEDSALIGLGGMRI